MEMNSLKHSLLRKLRSMLKVDFKRLFTMPLIYILAGVCLAMPILILVMTTMIGGTSTDPTTGEEVVLETFTNVWQAIGSISRTDAMAMDLTSMCNINMLYFLVPVLVCVFVGEDFRSGYAKNLFTVRSKKIDYVFSKSLVGFVGATIMFLMYFIGSMIGGAIAGLSFDMVGFGVGGIIASMLSKIFVTLIFVAIALLLSVVAKQKLWLSIICSLAAGMLLYTMLPMMTPLTSGFLNIVMCFVGSGIFAVGLGSVSNLILNKTSLV